MKQHNRDILEAEDRLKQLNAHHKQMVEDKITQLDAMGFHKMALYEKGRILHHEQENWSEELRTVFPFSSFEFLIAGRLGPSRPVLVNCKTVWRIYHTILSSEELAKLQQNAELRVLVANAKSYVRSVHQEFKPEDFYIDPIRIFEQISSGQTTWRDLNVHIQSSKAGRLRMGDTRADFKHETDIQEYIWRWRGRLATSQHKIDLRGREVGLPVSGLIDFAGIRGNDIIVLEVKWIAEHRDVGQLLSYINEMSDLIASNKCEAVKCTNGDLGSVLLGQSWHKIYGCIAAQGFSDSFYYAAQRQKITAYKVFRSMGILSSPFELQAATFEDWLQFVK